MKNLFVISVLLLGSSAYAQIVISDRLTSTSDKLDSQIELFINSDSQNKGIVLPYVTNSTSLSSTNMKDGMMAYSEEKECFVYYRDGWISDCIVDNKRAYSQNVRYDETGRTSLASATYRSLTPISGNSVVVLTKKSLVRIAVSASHQYIQSAGTGTQCAKATLGLFQNGGATPVKSTYHQTIATAQGNIFPVSFVYVAVLDPGTYTFTLQEAADATCNSNLTNWFWTADMSITYKQVN